MASRKNSVQYQRIIEILEDYWINEPTELKVRVSMDFVKANGETQSKSIVWINPDYTYVGQERPAIISIADITDEYIKQQEREFWNVTNYKKKETSK